MKCPFCGKVDTKVSDTRTLDEDSVIKRRRVCESCGGKFVTFERVETTPMTVIKRGGGREAFDRDKIRKGIMFACNKRAVSAETVERVVDEIEGVCLALAKREIETSYIGDLVMDRLKDMDEVAYARFASVYKQFKDIDTFVSELDKLRSGV